MWTAFMSIVHRAAASDLVAAWIVACPFIWMVMFWKLERERRGWARQREELRKCWVAMDAAVRQVAGIEQPSLEELRDNDEKVRNIHTRGHVDCPACEANVREYRIPFGESEDEYYRRIRQKRLAKGDDDVSK